MEPRNSFEWSSARIASNHEWGRWHQTVYEVNVEVNLPPGTSARTLSVKMLPNELDCRMREGSSKILLKGKLFAPIKVDESIWTVEERCTLRFLLAKERYTSTTGVWTSLFKNGVHAADKETEERMRRKLESDRMQIEFNSPGCPWSGSGGGKAKNSS